jgi:hypothetical protein
VVVWDDEEDKFLRKNKHNGTANSCIFPSSGKITVNDLDENRSKQIKYEEYLRNKHKYKPVLGGIVCDIDGVRQYVSKDEFTEHNLNGIHKGKITAYSKEENKMVHISVGEFHKNRELYQTATEGKITVKNKQTGITKSIKRSEYENQKDQWSATTTGFRTVYDTIEQKTKNIPVGDYDGCRYVDIRFKKIIVYNQDGKEIDIIHGLKKDFIKKYPESLYNTGLTNTVFKSNRTAHKQLNGYYCKIIKEI